MTYFICAFCKKKVTLKAPGTKNRNHCPFCLYSLHVDNDIGDRKSTCLGLMEPLGKFCKEDGEEILVHRCMKCRTIRKNRIAGDDDFKAVESLKVVKAF